jgi:hypothetical protein
VCPFVIARVKTRNTIIYSRAFVVARDFETVMDIII